MRYLIFGIAILTLFFACSPVEENISEVEIDITDPEIRKIVNFQDKQAADSLLGYFGHSDPVYRYLSALAFASIRNPQYTDTLGSMLNDPADIVRMAAAFSIGQSGGENADNILLDAFDQYDTSGYYVKMNRTILEAIGKVGEAELLEPLSSISTYEKTDTALLEGQAWGIYRYALRNITSFPATKKMVEYALDPNIPGSVRLIAANYLYRARGISLDTFANALAANFSRIEDPNIRMALAAAMGKAKRPIVLDTLIVNFKRETDYRVKCNILVAFGAFDYKTVQPVVLEALNDENLHVAKRAASFFIQHGIPEDATFYRRTAKEIKRWPVEIGMYAAANRHLPSYLSDYRGLINYDLRRKFGQANFPYEKAAILDALAEYPWNYRTIYQFGKEDTSTIIKTASISALGKISDSEKFRRYFGLGYRQVTRELFNYFVEAISSGDPGQAAIAAVALRNPERGFKTYIDSLTFLETAIQKLDLPREVETHIALNKTLAFLSDKQWDEDYIPEYNNPINWDKLDEIDNQTRAAIQTSKGTIIIRLFPDVAPGTVANFVKLIKAGFYEHKNFHRVVPNFVIQGGCTRGDGYGSLDYTIRSELSPLHYNDGGYVGMASAGNHTESTQFFITHSPTPHLDGNYAIFAKVTNGMEVVQDIQPGDEIESIIIR